MSNTDALTSLFAAFERLRIRNYTTGEGHNMFPDHRCSQGFEVASLVFLISEHLQTLESEIELVWASKLNIVNALFFGARYLGFINIPILFLLEFEPSTTPETCKVYHGSILMIMAVSTTCSDAIAYIRLCALANRSRAMQHYLHIQFVVVYLAFYITLLIDLEKTIYIPSPYPDQYPCYRIRRLEELMAVPFIIILFSMISTCTINLFFVTRCYYDSKNPLLRVFYVDGTFSYIIMAAVTLGKVLLHVTGPDEYLTLLTAPHQAIHSTLAARMLLRMREAAHEDDCVVYEEQRLTDLIFTPPDTTEEPTNLYADVASSPRSYSTEGAA